MIELSMEETISQFLTIESTPRGCDTSGVSFPSGDFRDWSESRKTLVHREEGTLTRCDP